MTDPYITCDDCLVKDWCGRREGSSPLPPDYDYNPDCVAYIKIERALELSEIPTEFRNATKMNYVPPATDEGKTVMRDLFVTITPLVDGGFNLGCMHPNKGTGKTFTAIALGLEYLMDNVLDDEKFNYEDPLIYYVKYGAWANELRNIYRFDKDEDFNLRVERKMRRMKKVPLLIIDDIGSGRMTDYIRDLTYDLIDYRKENKLSTFFTTNMTREQLDSEAQLSSLITSRLFYNTMVLQMGGDDKRANTTTVINII